MNFEHLISGLKGRHDRFITFVDARGGTCVKSHDELHRDVLDLTSFFKDKGLMPRSKIGVLGRNSYDFVVVELALLECGGVPVVFPDSFLSQDIDVLAATYELSLMLVDAALAGNVRDLGKVALYRDTPDGVAVDLDASLVVTPANAVGADVLTYAFSSGTTGGIKALVVSKTGTVKVIEQFIQGFEISGADTHYSFLPLSYFQQRVLNYMALDVGANITIVAPEKAFNQLPQSGATFIVAPPTFHDTVHKMVRVFERSGMDQQAAIRKVLGNDIRFMITAMAPISTSTIEYFWERGICLFQTYALTEAGFATWNNFAANSIGSVGCEAEPGTLKIDDDGELIIYRDKPVTLGYFAVDEAVARETFRSDGGIATGDIVSRDANGFYTIIGRKKNIIVTPGGEKFQPEELETALYAAIDKEDYKVVVIGCENSGDTIALFFATHVEDFSAPAMLALLRKSVAAVNAREKTYKHIRKALVSKLALTYENGLMTRNLKLDRNNIKAAYQQGCLGTAQSILLEESSAHAL